MLISYLRNRPLKYMKRENGFRGLATTSVRREPSTPLPGLATGRRLQGMEASGVAKRPSLGTLPFRADSGPRAACGVAPFLDR